MILLNNLKRQFDKGKCTRRAQGANASSTYNLKQLRGFVKPFVTDRIQEVAFPYIRQGYYNTFKQNKTKLCKWITNTLDRFERRPPTPPPRAATPPRANTPEAERLRRRNIQKAKEMYGTGCQIESITRLREIAVRLGGNFNTERSKKKICDFIGHVITKEKSFRERKADAISTLPGGWDPIKCSGRGPGAYKKYQLVAAAKNFGISPTEISSAGSSHKALCGLLKKHGIDKNTPPARRTPTPPARRTPTPPARRTPTPPARRTPPAAPPVVQGGVYDRLHRMNLKDRFNREHKKRGCQKKTRTNPEPYTTKELSSILKRDYGFTSIQMRKHLADKFGIWIGRTRFDYPGLNKYKYRTELCKMAQIYFDTGARPNVTQVIRANEARERGLSPTSQRKIDNFEASLPREHPIFSSMDLLKRTWLKLQLRMRLTDIETRTQRTREFDLLAQRAMQFNLDRMMQQQMNEPEIRTVGLNDPGNNWSPAVGNNVNNVLNTAQNNLFLAGNIPNANKAVYLKNNVQSRKIQAVYNQNGLKTWLMKKKSSPYTSKEIGSWNSVKRVPEKIMRRHGDNVYWAIQDAEELQNIHKTKYVDRLLKIFKEGKTFNNFRRNVRNGVHVRNEEGYQDLRKSCATYMTMLKDYVMSKAKDEQKGVLERLDKRNPACVENACSSINEFIQEDSNEFAFDFDPEADRLTNISNCANALRKSYCVMLKKKEINEKAFIKKMKGLYQSIFNNVRNKEAKNGKIQPSDIREFLEGYGEMLLECPEMKLPETLFKGFKFNFSLGGAL